MDKANIISGVGHVSLILWVLLGDILFSPPEPPEMAVTEVSLMSSAEFDALVAASPTAPPAPEQTDSPTEAAVEPPPEPEQTEAPEEPAPPPEPAPEAEAEPLPETLPEEAVPQPLEAPRWSRKSRKPPPRKRRRPKS